MVDEYTNFNRPGISAHERFAISTAQLMIEHEAAEYRRLIYGDPGAPKPTGIMYADAVVLDEVREHKPALPSKWTPGESWRRKGKRRGRMS